MSDWAKYHEEMSLWAQRTDRALKLYGEVLIQLLRRMPDEPPAAPTLEDGDRSDPCLEILILELRRLQPDNPRLRYVEDIIRERRHA